MSDALPPPSHVHERDRARRRREGLGVQRPPGHEQEQWALSLSGGGIRSATFCLGLLQALAKSPSPASVEPAGSPQDAVPGKPSLLSQFDYLSTVSGGGYIGAFFSSLFVTGRLSGDTRESDLTAARRAYEVLQEDPPERIRADTAYQPGRPGAAAIAWLRDNGRYMAPTGTGDVLYGVAIALRNWVATQYVVGLVMAMALSLLLVARLGLVHWSPAWRALEHGARLAAASASPVIWWSPSWFLPAVVALLATLPLGMAYWFSHPSAAVAPRDYLASKPRLFTRASVLGLLVGLGLGWLGQGMPRWGLDHPPLQHGLLCASAVVLLAVGWFIVTACHTSNPSISHQRVILTRWLSFSLMLMLSTSLLAAVETVAQTSLLRLEPGHGVATAGALGALVWLLRHGAKLLGDKTAAPRFTWVPLNLLVGAVGVVLWFTLACALEILLLRAVWADPALPASAFLAEGSRLALLRLALGSAGVLLILNLVVGRFPGFLNLSTFQNLYSARLIRAYLGGSNFRRFDPAAPARNRDVAEPIDGDSLPLDAIYANPCAPTHFINVCVNQTVSPGEQLLQRDRKGKPLVMAPHGFYVDKLAHALAPTKGDKTELAYPLSYGEWVGVSGAAFSTGLGRASNLGLSLALGFANVRLGRWWPGVPRQDGGRDGFWRRCFTPQVYLIDELRSRFFGDHRQYQYLSDGGHFENTGVYELLNPDRNRDVRLIVLADCGCDPDYEFEDLANLVRLARIDHGLNITVNHAAPADPQLGRHFARPEDFRRRADGSLPADQHCAVLLDVRTSDRATHGGLVAGSLVARIVLIKPAMPRDLPADIGQYQLTHAQFPHEPTVDLFFDEAQWESYRQLGLIIGRRVLPQDITSAYAQAFWRVCLDGLPPDRQL